MPRILRNLKIMEVSGVDRGAGEGVKIMLMKRAEPSIDLAKRRWGDDFLEFRDGDEAMFRSDFRSPNGLMAYVKREFSESERQSAASAGEAMPGGGFPIKSESDLHNAIRAIGRAKDPAAAKAHIKRRAKALGLSNLIPDTWKRDGGADVISLASIRKALAPKEVEMTESELQKMISDSVAKAIAATVTPVLEKLQKDRAPGSSRMDAGTSTRKPKPRESGGGDSKVDHNPDDEDQDGMNQPSGNAQKSAEQIEKEALAALPASVKKQLADAEADRKVLKQLQTEQEVRKFEERAIAAGLKKEDGETMRKAYGGDSEAQVALDKRFTELTKQVKALEKTSKVFSEIGTALPGATGSGGAYDELMVKARELRKAQPVLSESQAFAKVMGDEANRELVAREKAERMAKISGVMHAA